MTRIATADDLDEVRDLVAVGVGVGCIGQHRPLDRVGQEIAVGIHELTFGACGSLDGLARQPPDDRRGREADGEQRYAELALHLGRSDVSRLAPGAEQVADTP